MKRILPSLVLVAVVVALGAHVAQTITTVQDLHAIVSSAGCTGIGTNQYGNAQICFDASTSMQEYIRDTNGNWTLSASGTFNPLAPGPIGSTTASTGAFTTLTATSIPSAGAIGGTTPAAGTFTTLTGTTITATTGFVASGTGASAISATNGGVISSALGTGSIPTATCSGGSTGVSIAATSTDNRGQITTSSSASTNCTITFNHTWPQAPFCVFTDANSSVTPVAYSFDVAGSGTTAVKFDFASATSKVVNYLCL